MYGNLSYMVLYLRRPSFASPDHNYYLAMTNNLHLNEREVKLVFKIVSTCLLELGVENGESNAGLGWEVL